MSTHFRVGVLLLGAIAASCSSGEQKRPAAQAAAAAPITVEDLANATYTGFHEPPPVTLVNGKWVGPPYEEGSAVHPEIRLERDLTRSGDLDGDGTPEAVAFLTATGGVTGAFDMVDADWGNAFPWTLVQRSNEVVFKYGGFIYLPAVVR